MINKNQLKKSTSRKYVLLFPALMAFMACFQVTAQEKQQHKKNTKSQRGVDIVISKNTSDAEIKGSIEKLIKEQRVALEFSKIERNKQGEIIAIRVKLDNTSEKRGTAIEIRGDGPIKPIRFYKSDDGDIVFDPLGNTMIIKP